MVDNSADDRSDGTGACMDAGETLPPGRGAPSIDAWGSWWGR